MEFNFRDLPYVVKREAFRQMNTLEKICYSLQSEKSKRLIQPLIPQANKIEVTLGSSITVRTDTNEFSIKIQLFEQNHIAKGPIPMPVSVRGKSPDFPTSYFLDHPEFSLRDWIDFLADVLRCNSIKLKFRGPSTNFNRDSIMETFKELKIAGLAIIDCSPDRTRWYLDTFPPTKSLRVSRNPYNGPLPDIFRRQFNTLHLLWFFLTLSDVLLLNSRNITIESGLSGSDCNRFLKEWIQGWNPGLQTMLIGKFCLRYYANNTIQRVMDGIAHSVLPNDYEMSRSGYDCPRWRINNSVLGAFKIEGNDGRKAAIKIELIGRFFNMKMVVL